MISSACADSGSRRCVLTGPPGVGKSTVGRGVAAALGWDFIDLDGVIAAEASATIAQLFEREGEAAFRRRERECLRRALAHDRVVIAAGGGALVDREIRHETLRSAWVVSLDAPIAALRARLSGGVERPLLARAPEALERLLADRRAGYCEAHATIAAEDSTEAVVASVASAVLGPRPMVMPLGERTYRVFVGPLADLGRQPAVRATTLLVSDATVHRHWGAAITAAVGTGAPWVVLRPGERSKTLRSVARVWDAAATLGADRRAVFACVGGGVITDVGGFAASTWLRGVSYVSVPTSLLAMVDASVGGKTGVDLRAGKNLVGAFHQPRLVWIDPSTLGTLAPRQYRSALAEVVKVAAVCDGALLAWLEDNVARLSAMTDPASLAPGGAIDEMIRRAVQAKIDVVAADEREAGVRALLNFGHTVGHALEVGAGYRALHGDCVAVGMRAELRLGQQLGVTSGELRSRVVRLLDGLGLARTVAALPRQARAALRLDKKRENGSFRVALMSGPGEGAVVSVPAAALTKVLDGVIEIR